MGQVGKNTLNPSAPSLWLSSQNPNLAQLTIRANLTYLDFVVFSTATNNSKPFDLYFSSAIGRK